jgi:hypothetical protein
MPSGSWWIEAYLESGLPIEEGGDEDRSIHTTAYGIRIHTFKRQHVFTHQQTA